MEPEKKIEEMEEISPLQCTEVRFAGFLSGGFTTIVVIKLAKRTSVQCTFMSVRVTSV